MAFAADLAFVGGFAFAAAVGSASAGGDADPSAFGGGARQPDAAFPLAFGVGGYSAAPKVTFDAGFAFLAFGRGSSASGAGGA